MTPPKPDYQSVDAYIASQPEAAQRALEQVRAAVRKGLPKAEEVISYGMPAYKLNSARVLYFAAWKQHYSLYAATASALAKFKNELARYKIQKGTIQFPISEPVPENLIERIAKFRAREVAQTPKSATR